MGWIPSCLKRKPVKTAVPTVQATPAPPKDTVPDEPIAEEEKAETNDDHFKHPEEVFKYWAGEEPWEGIEVIDGQGWQTDFFWKEYSLSLGFKMSIKEAREFSFDEKMKKLDKLPDMKQFPDWFKVNSGFEVWEGNNRNYYFLNRRTGVMYLHEEQY